MLKGILIFLIFITSFAQQQNANEILNDVKKKFEAVQDYSVDLNIEVDMEFLRIPNVTSKVYFKRPDKMKMESDDFAVLPKEGINFSPAKLLNGKYTAIYVKSDTINKSNVDVVKIIPLDDSVGIVLTTLWIDTNQKIIRKIETTTKNRGTFQIELFYGKMEKFGLPAKMQFTFSVENLDIPKNFANKIPLAKDNKKGIKKTKGKTNKNFKGNIVILYSNYKINQGLDDSFFDEKEKK